MREGDRCMYRRWDGVKVPVVIIALGQYAYIEADCRTAITEDGGYNNLVGLWELEAE